MAAFDPARAQAFLEDPINALRAAPKLSATAPLPDVKPAQEPPKEDKGGQFEMEL